MKTLIIVALVGVLATTGGFALGRATTGGDALELSDDLHGRDVILRIGDQLRIPSIDLFCVIDVELERIPRMLCNHTGRRPRYQVRFERDRTEVGRIGFPGDVRVFREQP